MIAPALRARPGQMTATRELTGPLVIGALLLLTARLISKRRRAKVKAQVKPYTGPAGGWGSARAVGLALMRGRVLISGSRLLLHQNKSKGFACVSCAWAKPKSRALEFCENGAKASAWEIDAHRAGPEFFSDHTVSELLNWSDHQLERQGRLTTPLRWDKESDKFLPVQWARAFDEIGSDSSGTSILNPSFSMPPGAPHSKLLTCTP